MNKIKKSGVVGLLCVFSVLMLAGCAASVVKEKDLYRKTAFALLCAPDTLTITAQRSSGARVDYTVQTHKGTVYHCFVRGGYSLSGRTVSDATCQQQ